VIQFGKMIGTTPPNTAILTDKIALTTPTWSTKISSEVHWEPKNKRNKITMPLTFSAASQRLCKITKSRKDQRAKNTTQRRNQRTNKVTTEKQLDDLSRDHERILIHDHI
jgi:hypothetical protein